MPDIVISEAMDLRAVESLKCDFEVVYDPDLVNRPSEIVALVDNALALIVRNQTQVNSSILEKARKLKALGRLGVGLDNIDLIACKSKGVEVFLATGANTTSVAELVIGAMIALVRKAFLLTEDVKLGKWPRLELGGREVMGLSLGFIGFGAISRAVASRAQCLGMDLYGTDPFVSYSDPIWVEYGVKPLSFVNLLKVSDVITIHVPLEKSTEYLIDQMAIESMKTGAVLINTSRGRIVSEIDMISALHSGKLSGAFLDVFENEPVIKGSRFDGVPNLILSPHIGAMTEQGNARVSKMVAENISNFLKEG